MSHPPLLHLPCSLQELKSLNISPSLKTFCVGSALRRSAVVLRSGGCDAGEREDSVPPPSERSVRGWTPVETARRRPKGQKLYVKGLHLGAKWLPGARHHASPVERPVPRPLPHHFRIISLSGELLIPHYFQIACCHLFHILERSGQY